MKNRLKKDPIPKKYVGTPLMIVWRNTKSSKDFYFTIANDISEEETVSLSLNDVKTNRNLNIALHKSINRLDVNNKDIRWRYLPEILQSESLKTTKRISIDTFTSSRFESDSESFTSRGEYDESETEREQNTQPDTGRCSSPKKVSPAIKIPLVMDNEEGFLKVTKPTWAM